MLDDYLLLEAKDDPRKDRVWSHGGIRLILHRVKDHNPPHLHVESAHGEILYIPEETIGKVKMCRIRIPRIIDNQGKIGDIDINELVFYNCLVTRPVGEKIVTALNAKESKNKPQNWESIIAEWIVYCKHKLMFKMKGRRIDGSEVVD